MEKIELPILDGHLAKEVYTQLRTSQFRADPWRLYQVPYLVKKVAQAVLTCWGDDPIDIVISISNLGIPFGISIVWEAKKLFSGSFFFLDPSSKKEWIFPSTDIEKLQNKKVLLCDELMSTGLNAWTALRRLQENNVQIGLFSVLLDNTGEPERSYVSKILSTLSKKTKVYAMCNPSFL